MRSEKGDSAWSRPETVAGFSQSPPNPRLIHWAETELARTPGGHLLDLGCGAGRNLIPMAKLGWHVTGIDLSRPMLDAAAARVAHEGLGARAHLLQAPMAPLPVPDTSADFVVAHGICNLARSAAEFRLAVADAGRAARPGAALFVFTFSRHTLSPDATPVAGEPFVFTQFSGQPQCFLTEAQLESELQAAGFYPDPAMPLRELNRPAPGALASGAPVIFEGGFRHSHG